MSLNPALMTRSFLLKSVLCTLMVPTLSCNLLKVSDDEESRSGRGAKLHDPYQGANSGAIRLSLQMLNGCAALPSGQMAGTNGMNIPYPEKCPDLTGIDPFGMPAKPTGTLKLLGKTTYFLNQLSISDTVLNQHTNPADLRNAVEWITTKSRFAKLNWRNVGQSPDRWLFIKGSPGAFEDSWTREVLFENAEWMKEKDDTITIEVLDPDGSQRTKVVYDRSELVVDTPHAGHSRFAWRMENALSPRFPGDTEPRGVTFRPGRNPQGLNYRTLARIDLIGSSNPFKTFTTPDLKGAGALKVTWSLMPDDPFYFPVTFVPPEEVPATCTNDRGEPVQCGFGLDPQMVFAPPANGSHYALGETLNLYVDLRDSQGNRLHSPELIPSAGEILADQANGIILPLVPFASNTLEADATPMISVAGPLHKMRVNSDPNVRPEYLAPENEYPFLDDLNTSPFGPTRRDAKYTTRFSRKLSADPDMKGTYVALVKFTRYYMGERVTKINPVFFQVGTDDIGTYPGRVGNCQICHRGVLSLDNLRHGLSVDNIEACKSCHLFDNDAFGRPQEFIHRIHMNSRKFTADKNDCTLCHLTRESALRPSISVCSSCHPSTHDTDYFQATFSNSGQPNRFSTCAESCHGEQAPKNHILPN
jgi:hypothetical protein